MPELRWILIILGLLLLAGLWWWETQRRLRNPVQPPDGEADADDARPEQVVSSSSRAAKELPSIRASRRERTPAARELPVVEIPDDAEPELARKPPEDAFVPPSVPYRSIGEELDDIPEELRNLPRDVRAEAEEREPWIRTQPLDRRQLKATLATQKDPDGDQGEELAEGPAEAPNEAAGPGQDESHSDAARQRIVALRLICDHGRWPGRDVIDALQAEGLSFGKYSIFHRLRDDGKTIFFVASMVEPGSFDLERADEQSFPGVSVFAVIPGPVDAPTTFDLMLASGRRLAERLGGHLQDEQGSTLTAQRVLNLREELVHFEHVSIRLKKR